MFPLYEPIISRDYKKKKKERERDQICFSFNTHPSCSIHNILRQSSDIAKSSIHSHYELCFPLIILPFSKLNFFLVKKALLCRTYWYVCDLVGRGGEQKDVFPPLTYFPIPFHPGLFLHVICMR